MNSFATSMTPEQLHEVLQSILERLGGVEDMTKKHEKALKENETQSLSIKSFQREPSNMASRGLMKQESIMNAETSHAANTGLGLAKKALADASQALVEAQKATDDVNRMSAQLEISKGQMNQMEVRFQAMKGEFEGVRTQALEAKLSSTSSTAAFELQEHSSILSQLNVSVSALQSQLKMLTSDLVGIKAKQEEIESDKIPFSAASSLSNSRMLGRIQTKLDDTAAAIVAGGQGNTSPHVSERISALEAEIAKLKSTQKQNQSNVSDSSSSYETMLAAMKETNLAASTARTNASKALVEASRASDEVTQLSGALRMAQSEVGLHDAVLNSLQQQFSTYQSDTNQVKSKVLDLTANASNYDSQLSTVKESVSSLRQVTASLQSKIKSVENDQEEFREAVVVMQKQPFQVPSSVAALAAGQGVGSPPFVAERISALESEIAKAIVSVKSINVKVAETSSDYEVLVSAVEEATRMATAARNNASNASAEASKASGEVSALKSMQADMGQLDSSLKALQKEFAATQSDLSQSKDKISQLATAADSNSLEMQDTTKSLLQMTNSLQLGLKALEADYEDFRESTRTKLQQRPAPVALVPESQATPVPNEDVQQLAGAIGELGEKMALLEKDVGDAFTAYATKVDLRETENSLLQRNQDLRDAIEEISKRMNEGIDIRADEMVRLASYTKPAPSGVGSQSQSQNNFGGGGPLDGGRVPAGQTLASLHPPALLPTYSTPFRAPSFATPVAYPPQPVGIAYPPMQGNYVVQEPFQIPGDHLMGARLSSGGYMMQGEGSQLLYPQADTRHSGGGMVSMPPIHPHSDQSSRQLNPSRSTPPNRVPVNSRQLGGGGDSGRVPGVMNSAVNLGEADGQSVQHGRAALLARRKASMNKRVSGDEDRPSF